MIKREVNTDSTITNDLSVCVYVCVLLKVLNISKKKVHTTDT